MPVPPPTAYPTGTKLTVGSHEVEIGKFIGEGGFAHVYTVTTNPVIPGHEVACLKRVQVPNKAYLNLLRAEVDAMQRLKGASNIVQYFDSHAERMHDPKAQGQYEVFLLMEYCERGGLIDFMNTRLRDRLRENEILKIMYDITLGLAHMHYLMPALLHRDLKIENVLITGEGDYKLCDFGSVSPVLRPPKTPQEFQILEDDIQHHTTVQYRAPEMVAIARGHPIDEKSDIWALGIFLYKLCYYTTPFERPNQTLEQFQQLILAGVFTIPARPAYSERLQHMIRVLLNPDPRLRPNVYQVMEEICSMRKVSCPLENIYIQPQQQQQQQQQQQAPPQIQTLPIQPPAQELINQQQMLPQRFAGVPGYPQQAIPGGIPQQNMPTNYSQPASLIPGAGGPGTIRQSQSQTHLQSTSYTRPAPGQVPVPGVLLTSPMVTPTSPLSRPESPLGDEHDITTRFPSLEELDLADGTSLVDFNSSASVPQAKLPQRMPSYPTKPTKPLQAAPQQAAPQRASIQAQPAAAQQQKSQANAYDKLPPKPTAVAAVTASSSDNDYELPPRPSRRRREEDERLLNKLPSAEAVRLQQILTGISNKSSTVIMDTPPENRNLSSVDFLRTLQTSGEGPSQGGHSLMPHHKSFHKPRKPSLHKHYYHENRDGYDEDDDDDDDDDDDGGYARISRQGKPSPTSDTRSAYEEYHVDDKYSLDSEDLIGIRSGNRHGSQDSDSEDISPLASPSSAPPASPARLSRKPTASKPQPTKLRPTKGDTKPAPPKVVPSSKPKLDKIKTSGPLVGGPSNPISSSKPVTRASTAITPGQLKPRPKSMIVQSDDELSSQSTGSLDTYRPSNSIQQRVYSLLTSHERQHPTRRTAKGYGRFTDSLEYGSDDDSDYGSIKTTRSKSLGDGIPPPPSRASKPKVKH